MWIPEIDGLRGVAILAVIVIHTSANFTQIDTINSLLISNLVIDVFAHFAVPLFVFISGYVLSSKYQQVTATYYSKRIKSITLPYISFSIFYLLCSTLYNAELPPPNAIYNLLTGGYGYLWFLLMILQLYLLYPFLRNRVMNQYILGSAFVAQLTWILFGSMVIPSNLVGLVFLSHIFYFVLGIYAQGHSTKLKASYLVLIPILTAISSYSLIGKIVEYGGYDNIPNGALPLYTITSTALFTLTVIGLYNITFSIKWPKVLLSLGRYSFGIYLIHAFFMSVIGLLLEKAGITPLQWQFYPIMFACTLVCSFGFTWVMWRLPFISTAIGAKSLPKTMI